MQSAIESYKWWGMLGAEESKGELLLKLLPSAVDAESSRAESVGHMKWEEQGFSR